MNALHLLWIIPLSVWFGFAICAILTISKNGSASGVCDNVIVSHTPIE